MPKVPAYKRGVSLVKGEPDRKLIKPTTIDRAKYQSILDKPLNTGDNFVTSDPNSFVPDVMATQGFNYHSGTVKGKDLLYKKGNNFYLYNEQPGAGGASNYGLVNIGDMSEPKVQTAPTVTTTPAVMPVDPMKQEGFNGMLKSQTIQYKNGGKVKGYGDGTPPNGVVPQYNLATQAQGPAIQTTGYASAIAEANAKNQAINAAQQRNLQKQQDQDEQKRQEKNGKIGQQIGTPVLAVGTAMYNNASNDNDETKMQKGAIDTALQSTDSSMGISPWYGIAKGISNIGRSQLKRDKYGNVTGGVNRGADEFMAPMHENAMAAYKREGVKGALKEFFTPAAALRGGADILGKGDETSGVWGAINKFSGNLGISKDRNKGAEAEQAQRDAQAAEDAKRKDYINKARISEAIAARDAGDVNYKPTAYNGPVQKSYAPLSGISNQNRNTPIKNAFNDARESIGNAFTGLGKKYFAEGGEIKGKGGPKSDSISATVEAGSFIVPAENAPIAKELAVKILRKAPSKKANLNQGGETPVKLSDGEYMFSPEEKAKLVANGVDLEALAPNAELKHGGRVPKYGDGTTPAGVGYKRKYSSGVKQFDSELDAITSKEYKSLDELNADIKKLDDMQAKSKSLNNSQYNSEINNVKQSLIKLKPKVESKLKEAQVDSEIEKTAKFLKENGATDSEINGYKFKMSNKTDKLQSTKREQAKQEVLNSVLKRTAKDASVADKNLLKTKADSFYQRKLLDATKKFETAKADPSKYTKEQIDGFAKEMDDAKTKILDVQSAIKEGGTRLVQERETYRKLSGDKTPSAPVVKKNVTATTEQLDNATAPKSTLKVDTSVIDPLNPNGNQYDRTMTVTTTSPKTSTAKSAIGQKAIEQVDVLQPKTVNQLPQRDIATQPLYGNKTPEQIVAANTEQMAADKALGDKPQDEGKSFDWEGIGSNAVNYGLPILQTAIGLKKLKELGKRPKDTLDPQYLQAIAKTSGDVQTARESAKFGYTGEELAALNQENTGLTNAGRAFARNVAGGSAAAGLNAERSVLNDAFGRKLQSRISDNALKMQKQEQAMARQQDLNSMLAHKQELNRRLFGDTLNAWNQDQSSAGSLVNAGLSNAIDSMKYANFKKQYEDTQNKYQF